jgi:hypothetical protein
VVHIGGAAGNEDGLDCIETGVADGVRGETAVFVGVERAVGLFEVLGSRGGPPDAVFLRAFADGVADGGIGLHVPPLLDTVDVDVGNDLALVCDLGFTLDHRSEGEDFGEGETHLLRTVTHVLGNSAIEVHEEFLDDVFWWLVGGDLVGIGEEVAF